MWWLIRTSVLGAALVTLGALAVRGFLIEPFAPTEVPVTVPCSGGLRGPVRVLVFSDVDFLRVGRRERALLSIARRADPDIVLVAGDFINHLNDPGSHDLLAEARRFLAEVPTRHGRFFVPGEDESRAVDTLRDAWRDTIHVLSNEGRTIETAHGRIELFGAHRRVDRVPWPLGREGDRAFVFSRPRTRRAQERLLYVGEGAATWTNVDITLAFQAMESRTYLDVRFAWNDNAAPYVGAGWRITRHEGRSDFNLYTNPSWQPRLRGRTSSGFIPPAGVWCRMRIRFEDYGERGRVRARFWKESDPEPATWSIDAYDPGPDRFRTGTIALGGRRGVRRYADLRVTDDTGRVLLEENFRDRKEFLKRWSSGSALETWAYDDARQDATRIVLAHEPDIALDLADFGEPFPCLAVTGHTHGGQVRIPGLGALHVPTELGRRFDRGLFNYRGVPLYITAGIGTSLIPIRLFDPPEVTVLTLVPDG